MKTLFEFLVKGKITTQIDFLQIANDTVRKNIVKAPKEKYYSILTFLSNTVKIHVHYDEINYNNMSKSDYRTISNDQCINELKKLYNENGTITIVVHINEKYKNEFDKLCKSNKIDFKYNIDYICTTSLTQLIEVLNIISNLA